MLIEDLMKAFIIFTFIFLNIVACNSLTHYEKSERAYEAKFNIEKLTLVLMSSEDEVDCFATLVNPTTAITAASCIKGKDVTVSLMSSGENSDDENKTEKLEIQKIHLHPEFSEQTADSHSNLAVIKLKMSKLITQLNLYYPQLMLFKKSYSSSVRKKKKLYVQNLISEKGISSSLYEKSSFSAEAVSINPADTDPTSFKVGTVGSLRYHKMYMLSGIMTTPVEELAPEAIKLHPFYLSRDFLSKHL